MGSRFRSLVVLAGTFVLMCLALPAHAQEAVTYRGTRRVDVTISRSGGARASTRSDADLVAGIDSWRLGTESPGLAGGLTLVRRGRAGLRFDGVGDALALWTQAALFRVEREASIGALSARGALHRTTRGAARLVATVRWIGTDLSSGQAVSGRIRVRFTGRGIAGTGAPYEAVRSVSDGEGRLRFPLASGREAVIHVADAETGAAVAGSRAILVTNGVDGLLVDPVDGYLSTVRSIRDVTAGSTVDLLRSGSGEWMADVIDGLEIAGSIKDALLGNGGLRLVASNLTREEAYERVLDIAEQNLATSASQEYLHAIALRPAAALSGKWVGYSTFARSIGLASALFDRIALLTFPDDPSLRFNVWVDDVALMGVVLLEPATPANLDGVDGTGIVSGRTYVDGVPAGGVAVRLFPRGATAPIRTPTESTSSGYFAFNGLPPGEYWVVASRRGCAAAISSASLPVAASVDARLTTLPPAALALQSSQVTVAQGRPGDLVVYNPGTSAAVAWSVVGTPAWLSVDPPAGSIGPGEMRTLRFNSTSSSYGHADVQIATSVGTALPLTVISLRAVDVQTLFDDLRRSVETVALGTNLSAVGGLAADADYVYWTVYHSYVPGQFVQAGELVRARKGGGPVERLATFPNGGRRSQPFAVAIAGAHAYVCDLREGTGTGVVWEVPKAGGTATILASGQSAPLAITASSDGRYVAWHDNGGGTGAVPGQLGGGGALRVLDRTTRALRTLGESRSTCGRRGVAIVDGTVWWAESGGYVRRAPVSGNGPATAVVSAESVLTPSWLVVNGGEVVFSDSGFGTRFGLHRVVSGGYRDVLTNLGASTYVSALADGTVWFRQDGPSGTDLRHVPLVGGTPTAVTSLPFLDDAFVDGRYLYGVTYQTPGRIVRTRLR